MIGDACVFALTQITNDFACEHGELVTRRAGPDIACQSQAMQQKCSCVYEVLKKTGLDVFELDDDLTQVPHGVWKKIQYGGLLGLESICFNKQVEKVNNIASTIQIALEQYEQIDTVPKDIIIDAMKSHRTRRRK